MDPNETLRLLREALLDEDAEMTAECAQTLDEWLSKGGFLPDAWTYGGAARPMVTTNVPAPRPARRVAQ